MADTGDKVLPRCKKPIGTYVPPAKRVKAEKFDEGSEEHQRAAWDENKRKITGLINRASAANLKLIVKELFNCNLIRYKGLFATAILRAQENSPKFTDVYAAMLAIINSRMRNIVLLVINRLILQYRLAFVNNNKSKCLAAAKFIAHLTNQEVVHEVLGFQLIDHLINKPTEASIEIVTDFLAECGAKLEELNPSYLFEVFKTLRDLSLENEFDTRTNELIDLLHMKRKDEFRANPPIKRELDLVQEEDRGPDFTHEIELSEPKKEDFHMEYNYFKFDPNWSQSEAKYNKIKKVLLEEESSEDDDDSSSSDGGDSSDSDEADDSAQDVKEDKKDIKPVIDPEKGEVKTEKIIDATGQDLIAFRRMVYLTIRSSIRHEEIVHKLLKSNIAPEYREELCQMILDCCGQDRTYDSVYGLVASKFCQLNRREYAPKFEKLFQQFYEVVHMFETNKIRNVSRFFAHLLVTESIEWSCLSCLKLREDATTSAGRCFIKFLFQELVSVLTMATLKEYIQEPSKVDGFKDLFPKEPEQDTRFAINFFTFSGMGELTEELRQDLLARQ
jgi:pre-mRNA-splicing factor CWC22